MFLLFFSLFFFRSDLLDGGKGKKLHFHFLRVSQCISRIPRARGVCKGERYGRGKRRQEKKKQKPFFASSFLVSHVPQRAALYETREEHRRFGVFGLCWDYHEWETHKVYEDRVPKDSFKQGRERENKRTADSENTSLLSALMSCYV